ncbi:hypothetical protein HPB49_015745 [Dermacentor silvarum]|uniref:Uncharacterized protein n=1 Tax=Dermacentor silvarum TaxID=543639 RepID=A0ACB8CYD3_DERSI|nr:hypothetical protein HPB49_015745 [Dermacentor silvarum]
MMARVGSCDAAPPLPAGRASSYAAASSTLPSPAIWTVHGSTLSPSYAVSTGGYDGPAVPASMIALSDTRSMTTSRVPQSPAQHAYYEITTSTNTKSVALPLARVPSICRFGQLRAPALRDFEKRCTQFPAEGRAMRERWLARTITHRTVVAAASKRLYISRVPAAKAAARCSNSSKVLRGRFCFPSAFHPDAGGFAAREREERWCS